MPADQQQQVAVALEVPREAHDQQRQDVEADAERGPRRLRLGLDRVPARDHHVADAVEQRGERQDRRRWSRDEPAVGHVRDERQPEDDAEERADVRRELRVLRPATR